MRYYVEAYRADGSQILGTLDGQTVLDCRYPERTAHVRRLRTAPVRHLSLNGCAAYYLVCNEAGTVVLTIDRT